jgi:hypothetical protein
MQAPTKRNLGDLQYKPLRRMYTIKVTIRRMLIISVTRRRSGVLTSINACSVSSVVERRERR